MFKIMHFPMWAAFLSLVFSTSCSSQTLRVERSKKQVQRLIKKSSKGEDRLRLTYKKEHFEFWKKYFTRREKERFFRHLANAFEVESVVKKILKQNGLPEDLFYVGLIESGYNTKIKSRAGAVGPWQFVRGTAKSYGLRVDRAVDERYNIFKSTKAAAHYFKDLYNIFGSWELALCAYNKGEYGMIRAIRKGNTRSYQELVRKGLIPKETAFYIPKIAAAKYLMQNAKKIGFNQSFDSLSDVVALELKKPFRARSIAARIGIRYDEFRKYNPDINYARIKPYRKGHRLYFPKKYTKTLVRYYQRDRSKERSFGYVAKSYFQHSTHNKEKVIRVSSGETLSATSKKY